MATLKTYCMLATGYACVRKIIQVYDGHVIDYGVENNKYTSMYRPLLIGEKLGIVLISTTIGHITTPFFIFHDMNILEISLKKRSLEDYGYNTKKTIVDYIFSP